MRPIPRFTADLHPASLVATLALGTVGGFVAKALHLPLPMLVGSLLAVGAAALLGVKPLGRAVQFPAKLRLFFIPVIGVAIGASFTPEILRGAVAWLPSLAALCLFIPLAHYLSFRALRATGTLDPITAFFGAAPGGLIETVQMGEEMGGDTRMLTMLQFLRLITTLIAVPLFFTALSGHAVGSAGGASMSRAQPGAIDLLWLLGAGVMGGLIGWRLKIPGGMVTGPILISALVHLSGLAQGAPPSWLVALTQLIIGTSLGVRFAGMELRRFWLALRLAGLSTSISIGLAAIFAFALARWVDEPISAVFLAFAPGGLVEMSLVALSLQLSAVFVTAHHALRIVLAVAAARALAPRLAK